MRGLRITFHRSFSIKFVSPSGWINGICSQADVCVCAIVDISISVCVWMAQLGERRQAIERLKRTNGRKSVCTFWKILNLFSSLPSILVRYVCVCMYMIIYCLYTFVHTFIPTSRTQSRAPFHLPNFHSLSSFSWRNNGGQASKVINVFKKHAAHANDGKQKRKKKTTSSSSVPYINIFET